MSNKQWCPIVRAAEIIGDQWSLLILRELCLSPQRFKSLKENINGISMDQLTRKLDHLCRLKIVVRQEFSESPPRVEYQLTELGRSFLPVLKRVFVWSNQNFWNSPTSDEIVDVTLTLRLMASFLGHGEGCVTLRLQYAGKVDVYQVRRFDSGRVSVESLDETCVMKSQGTLTINRRDWITLVSQKSQSHQKIWGRIDGDIKVIKSILPVFEFIEFDLQSPTRENQRPNENPKSYAIDRENSI